MASDKIFDALLVLQYQAGKKTALGMLVKRHHRKFNAHAFWYLRDIEASKDVVQDCWGIIANKLHTLRDPNSFSSWAMRIVTRKSIDELHKDKRKRETLDQYANTNADVTGADDHENQILQVKKAIEKLPKDHQIVLRLFYTQEYSLFEISGILDISIGTVKSRLYHAREKLKTILNHTS